MCPTIAYFGTRKVFLKGSKTNEGIPTGGSVLQRLLWWRRRMACLIASVPAVKMDPMRPLLVTDRMVDQLVRLRSTDPP